MTRAPKGSLAWEQQREFLEPDADSTCTCEGAGLCVQCPPTVNLTETTEESS